MSKSRGFILIFIPAATVFFSSAFIMILEIVAGRLIAKYVGSSLYTWTSVIGVVLAGISVGNYLGGRIADRFAARKALAVLFAVSSVACVVVVVVNNLVGEWQFLWRFSLPVRIFSHTSLVFLVPSTLLGMISPVVAKMALDQGLPAGRTVGDIYAWGAAGSIVGTFLAGFYLIAMMGTVVIIWTVAAALLLMSILYWAGLRVLYVWAAIFVVLMTMAAVPSKWAENLGSSLALRKQPDPSILYEDESQYCYITVQQLSSSPDERKFCWNGIYTHTYNRIVMNDITNLEDFYMQVYAAATHRLSQGRNGLSVLIIGGGGYVFPRYVEQVWPGSRVDVVEIDPGVTKAAMQAFGLRRDTKINTFNMDARNYIDELLNKQRKGEKIPSYDFIYEDAFDSYSVPFQLVTEEFNDKIAQILADDGVYMINLIDIHETGRFLCSLVNTIQRTFPSVCVVSKRLPSNMSGNVIIIAARRKINLENLDTEEPVKNLDLQVSGNSEIKALGERAQGIVLTDNYAPVENLLAPAALDIVACSQAMKYLEDAENLRKEGKWDESILKYKAVVGAYPQFSIAAYGGMGQVFANQGRWEKAISAAKSALEYNARAEIKQSMSVFHHNIGFALKKLGRNDEASQYIQKAIEGYREDLSKEPDSVETVRRLGNILAENGDFSEATKYFQQAVNMAPYDVENHSLLVEVLAVQGRYDEAIEQLYKGVRFMRDNGREDDAVTLERLLKWVESQKSEIR